MERIVLGNTILKIDSQELLAKNTGQVCIAGNTENATAEVAFLDSNNADNTSVMISNRAVETVIEESNVSMQQAQQVGIGNFEISEKNEAAKSSQSGLLSSDVKFSSLLSKHLYSTTMTSTGSRSNELPATQTRDSTAEETSKLNSSVLLLPAQNQIQIHPEILRLSSLLNNQNVVIGNNQQVAQVIYVPILATPQPANDNDTVEASVQQVITNSINTLSYGLVGAVPSNNIQNNLNNLVLVSPSANTVINPVNAVSPTIGLVPSQQSSSIESQVMTFIQPPVTLSNIIENSSTAMPVDNLLQQTEHSMLNFSKKIENTTITIPAVKNIQNTTLQCVPQNYTDVSHIQTVPLNREVKARGQKRKLSRNKSCSSDASSADSNINESQIGINPSLKPNVVNMHSTCTKKIERVRKTVNTEEELNNKVSGLVSKILSQFPKNESNSSNVKARTITKSPKRSRSDSYTDSTSMTKEYEYVHNTVIPKTVILAGEENMRDKNVNIINGSEIDKSSLISAANIQSEVESRNKLQASALGCLTPGTSLSNNGYTTADNSLTLINKLLAQSAKNVQDKLDPNLACAASTDDSSFASKIELSTIDPNNTILLNASATNQLPLEYVQLIQETLNQQNNN